MFNTELIISHLLNDQFAKAQGIVLEEATPTSVSVSLVVRADQTNFHGGTHGGVVFSLADCAFSLASNAYPDAAVAIDAHMAFTAGTGVGDKLVAVASELTRGRTMATYRVEVTRPDGRTIAAFTGTVYIKS